jgi:hypothetical protein
MRTIMLATAALLGWTSAAMAQAPAPPPQAPAAESAASDAVPVSLKRVRKQLLTPVPRKTGPGLRLEYHVDVYGRSPKLFIFDEAQPFGRGPVPFTAPTHHEIIDLVTPQMFKSLRRR